MGASHTWISIMKTYSSCSHVSDYTLYSTITHANIGVSTCFSSTSHGKDRQLSHSQSEGLPSFHRLFSAFHTHWISSEEFCSLTHGNKPLALTVSTLLSSWAWRNGRRAVWDTSLSTHQHILACLLLQVWEVENKWLSWDIVGSYNRTHWGGQRELSFHHQVVELELLMLSMLLVNTIIQTFVFHHWHIGKMQQKHTSSSSIRAFPLYMSKFGKLPLTII